MLSVSDEYLKLSEVSKIAKLSGQTIRRLEKLNKFPRRHKTGLRSVAWLRSDIQKWLCVTSGKSKDNQDDTANEDIEV